MGCDYCHATWSRTGADSYAPVGKPHASPRSTRGNVFERRSGHSTTVPPLGGSAGRSLAGAGGVGSLPFAIRSGTWRPASTTGCGRGRTCRPLPKQNARRPIAEALRKRGRSGRPPCAAWPSLRRLQSRAADAGRWRAGPHASSCRPPCSRAQTQPSSSWRLPWRTRRRVAEAPVWAHPPRQTAAAPTAWCRPATSQAAAFR
mmetsp:Transcript_22707/g.73516  ORF Transcript_22707/g.73516 Transcript_22707/m.73516 type:complete len:202 (+) Transcript_22707:458-1063(+)